MGQPSFAGPEFVYAKRGWAAHGAPYLLGLSGKHPTKPGALVGAGFEIAALPYAGRGLAVVPALGVVEGKRHEAFEWNRPAPELGFEGLGQGGMCTNIHVRYYKGCGRGTGASRARFILIPSGAPSMLAPNRIFSGNHEPFFYFNVPRDSIRASGRKGKGCWLQ